MNARHIEIIYQAQVSGSQIIWRPGESTLHPVTIKEFKLEGKGDKLSMCAELPTGGIIQLDSDVVAFGHFFRLAPLSEARGTDKLTPAEYAILAMIAAQPKDLPPCPETKKLEKLGMAEWHRNTFTTTALGRAHLAANP